MMKLNRISAEFMKGVNTYTDFLRDFEIAELVGKYKLCVSADTEYCVYINGSFVALGQYDDFPDHKVYDEIDITKYLKKGHNRLCITVYYQGVTTFQYYVGEPGLYFAVKGHLLDIRGDEKTLCAKSPAYQNGEIFKTTVQLGFGYIYDCRKEDGFLTAKKIPARFSPAKVCESRILYKRPIKKCVLSETSDKKILSQGYVLRSEESDTPARSMLSDYLSLRRPEEIFEQCGEKLKIRTDKDLYMIFDLGDEKAGYFCFDMTAANDVMLDFSYGEHLRDGRVRSYVGGRNFADRIYLKAGRNTFMHGFKRIAGRYLEIHVFGKLETIGKIGIIEENYPLKKNIIFNSNSKLCNDIVAVSENTLRKCMHEHYEDCPWREQSLYGSDSRNQMLCGYYAFGEYGFVKASFELMLHSMDGEGFTRICAPTSSDMIIPSFTLIMILALSEYLEYSGDKAFLAKNFDRISLCLDKRVQSMTNGLASRPDSRKYWNFYEWSFGLDGYDNKGDDGMINDGPYNVLLYIALTGGRKISEALGIKDKAKSYAAAAESIAKAVNQVFWNEKSGLYSSFVIDGKKENYSQLMQSLVLYAGIAGNRKPKICRALTQNKELVPISLSYTLYMYEGLLSGGKKYADFVYNDIVTRWGKMLYSDAKTFWETDIGESDFQDAGSLCHGWSAVPLYIFERYGMGITPEKIRKNDKTTGENLFAKYFTV